MGSDLFRVSRATTLSQPSISFPVRELVILPAEDTYYLRSALATAFLRCSNVHNCKFICGTSGHLHIAEPLSEREVDVTVQGGKYGNALQAASAEGHKEVVELLLERGADVNVQGGWYDNALQAAFAGGHVEIVKLLLERGADVNAQGGKYGNALQAASAEGHVEIVKLLLERGADVHAQGGWYGNALQAASAGGHKKIVKLLQEKGAEANAHGSDEDLAYYTQSIPSWAGQGVSRNFFCNYSSMMVITSSVMILQSFAQKA
ncbi:hypothetical protein VTN49DRAFT_1509 [Thermomyces lanuginosus]|uniref:uncharacterized protein n=1 Tax=Thermomyces lanuginosus TaxID=5541 RepID=UPI0037441C72